MISIDLSTQIAGRVAAKPASVPTGQTNSSGLVAPNTIDSSAAGGSVIAVLETRPASEQSQVTTEQPSTEQKKTLNTQSLSAAVEQLNDLVQSLRRELQFSVSENSGRTIITVINKETEEIVRQIPPDEVLQILEHLQDLDGGLLAGVRA